MRKLLLAGLFATASMVSVAASAYTLTNTNGGDGFVTAGPPPYTFTLTGANNGASGNFALYSATATGAATIDGSFLYTTFDRDGSAYDPAGYFVNDVFTQLSAALPSGGSNGGTFSFTVAAGDSYGFYVNSTDGVLGPGQLSVGGVPEPETWGLMIGGLAMTGLAMRRRKVALAA